MVDRKYSLPTLNKSDYRNFTYCVCAWGQGVRGREREREGERKREGEGEKEGGRERGGRVKYQSTSEVLATSIGPIIASTGGYTLSFDVSCFTTQTLLLTFPDYTGKAHPSLDFFLY